MIIALNILLLVIFAYLALCSAYALLFSIAGRMGKISKAPIARKHTKFAVLIPSYKEDEVILHTATEALKQNYPKDKFEVVVIADTLQATTIEKIRNIGATVIEVKFEKSTKAKSLNEAFRQLPEQYDFALILDADNIMDKNFLSLINNRLEHTGSKAIQGHRVAKNLNTNFAIMDAISEEVNNHIYRKGHRILGLSSGLIGSGMAFDYKMYKELMHTIDAVGGFDKESELKLLKNKVTIEYAEEALIYDEKVENAKVFGNQRTRWISAQLHYFRKFFLQGIWHLISRGNINFFDKAFQQFLMPRVLLMGSITAFAFLALVGLAIQIPFFPGIIAWGGLWVSCMLGIILAVPRKFYNKATFRALSALPKAILVMSLTLFRLKGANKKFIHTPHSVKDISN